MNAKQRRPGAGLGRYVPLLRNPRDNRGGWVVQDSHRRRPVRSILGRVRVFRNLERADRCAGRLNRKAGY
jgi:hypothetical protein